MPFKNWILKKNLRLRQRIKSAVSDNNAVKVEILLESKGNDKKFINLFDLEKLIENPNETINVDFKNLTLNNNLLNQAIDITSKKINRYTLAPTDVIKKQIFIHIKKTKTSHFTKRQLISYLKSLDLSIFNFCSNCEYENDADYVNCSDCGTTNILLNYE